ncbi:MAG: CBS domain-containing protein [Labilithrix sp.]|nr:CBS domain-containing protein [Labilithrix sp.]
MKSAERGKTAKLGDIMTTPVLKLAPSEPASDALAMMRDEGVRHAPVVEGNAILGIVSERDLGGPHGGLTRKNRTVRDLMRTNPVLGAPEMSVTDAVVLLRERRLGCLPIVDAGRLLGIVTRSDLLASLADLRRARSGAERGAADVPRPPLVVSPNRDKWP